MLMYLLSISFLELGAPPYVVLPKLLNIKLKYVSFDFAFMHNNTLKEVLFDKIYDM